jgi:GNAT superfamily N-acetyltransferase
MTDKAKPKASELEIRPALPADEPAVLELFRASLGWRDEDPNEEFFAWKHQTNPFGVSPAWLALHDGRVVGYRTFLRWAFLNDEGKTVTAVRAVDTATAPDYQGMGIFRTLTLRGVAQLTLDGVGIVFNTPNDQSRPGYLKMGWSAARRLPVGLLPRPTSLRKVLAARVPADLWSQPSTVGVEAADVLGDRGVAEALLAHAPSRGFRTKRSPEYLAWRTALRPLHYRLVLLSRDPAEGGIVVRLRRRGVALEAAVIEELVPNPVAGARLVARVLRETGADYAIGLRTGPSAGLLPVPVRGMGPLLTTRPLAASPPEASAWALTLGDVELF